MTRIDGLNPLATNRMLNGQSSQNVDGTESDATQTNAAGGRQDVLAVSNRGRVVAIAALAVGQSPDVRAAKVAALKASIADGTYVSNARDIAERLLSSGGLRID
jgi:negative regulator of flagellin synthesis FlgM